MSASGLREQLCTVDGVIAAAKVFDIELTPEQARRCVLFPRGDKFGWQQHPNAVSAGPIVFLKNRLRELGHDEFGVGLAEDDSLPLVFTTKEGSRKRVASICDVARSKMFRTPLAVCPIDLNAMRVSGFSPWNS